MVNHFYSLITIAFLTAWVQAGEVSATLDFPQIQAGEAATLVIRIEGGSVNQPALPAIPNLRIQAAGQNTMMSTYGGRMQSSQQYMFVVGTHIPGTYTIPALSFTIDGQTLSTKPLTLTVTSNGTSGIPSKPKEPDAASFGTLSLQLAQPERSDIFLTEIAPVIVRAVFPAESQLELRSGLQPEGNGFTLHNISDNAQQSQEMRDGKRYNVITFYGGISATRAGKIPLSLSIQMEASIPDASQQPLRHRKSGQLIGGNYLKKELTLKTTNQEIEVLPLPSEGKPVDFSGAVGTFEIDGIDIPQQWKTGEPQRVALRVKGSGNFAMMQAPPLTPLELWKTYPGQDQFTAGDRAAFSGNKIFQYNAIPRKAGTLPVRFTLHYFDPAKRSYQSIQSTEQSISITGADFIEPTTPTTPTTPKSAEADEPDALAPAREHNHRATISTWEISPRKMGLTAASLSLAAPLIALFLRRKNDPIRLIKQQNQRAIATAMTQTDEAIRQNDPQAYWQAARSTVQLPLAEKWHLQAHAITLHDVATRCGADSPLTTFFRAADTVTYGLQTPEAPWDAWRALHQQALVSLEKIKA